MTLIGTRMKQVQLGICLLSQASVTEFTMKKRKTAREPQFEN